MEVSHYWYKKTKPITIRKYQKTLLNEMTEEYNLTQNIFNPNKSSPNMFVNNLEQRMLKYYNNFSNSPEKKFIK